ncbi:Nonribosomal peptide synthetase 13 [Aspergillus carlsbadensis]|nr:Nonribosomal peptide synthetase 13 [Aspergillus carlsbadensis]
MHAIKATRWDQTNAAFQRKLPLQVSEESTPSSCISPVFTPLSTGSPPTSTTSATSSSENLPLVLKKEIENHHPVPPARNTKVPGFWNTLVHDVIQQRCEQTPGAVAIVAWDGSFTYGDLDQLSTRLASLLAMLGAKRETFVPVCMDKSKWTTVAVLGVLKAGAAFALLDPSYPVARLRTSIDDLEANLILTCPARSEKCRQIANTIVVEHLCTAWYPSFQAPPRPSTEAAVRPENALYIAFTSGSTGKPKGAVIEHRAYASGAREHLSVFQIDHTSRVLQFSSYAFDVSIMETLSTLMAGGCLCVLQESERTDPALFIEALNKYEVTHAMLTPSFARTMPWHKVRHLRTLIVGGEAMHSSEASFYAEHGIRLVNAYGTAECAVNSVVEPEVKPAGIPNQVSHPTGAVIWLIDPDDPERRVMPHAEGELMIEGPIVGRGYWKNPTATARAFIDPPGWLRRMRAGEYQHRVYRTGDLATQDPITGALILHGRREGQVKIRGQRVELADIEQHIRETLSLATEVVAEKVTTETDHRDSLVAFIESATTRTATVANDDDAPLFLPADPAGVEKFVAVQARLHEKLPAYMVPSVFIPVVCIPKTSSGKPNRSMLRGAAARLPRETLQAFAGSAAHIRPPATAAERELQKLYAEVLGVPLTRVGMDSCFVQLGGDSILAVRLIGAARRVGLPLNISDVMGKVPLHEQAEAAATKAAEAVLQHSTVDVYEPFSALAPGARADVLFRVQEQCGVPLADIEDVYPCTALQEGMFAVSMSQPGMYSDKIVLKVPEEARIQHQVRRALEETVHACPILRTRIVQAPEGLLQVVLRGHMPWAQEGEEEEEEEFGSGDPTCLRIGPGSPLMRCSLHGQRLTLTIHHAIWDGWTMDLVHDQLKRAFQGQPLRRHEPFHSFIKYLQESDNSAVDAFWRDELADLEAAVFPSLPSGQSRPSPSASLQHTVRNINITAHGHTLASYIHLAWSLVMAQYTDSAESVYGLTVSGRSAPLDNISDVAGPTIATIPMRVALGTASRVSEVLDQINARMLRMTPYEQAGLQRIARISAEAARACRFQTHLNIQVAASDDQSDQIFPVIHGTPGRGMDLGKFSNYALNLLIQLRDGGRKVTVHVAYDPLILTANEVARILQQWEHILHQTTRDPAMHIGAIDLVSPQDRTDLQRWNALIPTADQRTLHELVLAQEAQQPHEAAVSAWDGEFTYRQLVSFSSRLSQHLQASYSVGRGSFVLICMEKSRCAIVAILAVLRAGGTCVLLDPEIPRQRMAEILSAVSGTILVADSSTALLAKGLPVEVVCMSVQLTQELEQSRPCHLVPSVQAQPDDLAFVIFTSGSTGKPKGIAMPHSTLSTSIRYHSRPMRVDSSTRTLHFSSYAFDVSIYEIFTTLAAGGCICVPSEFERVNQLAESIRKYAVNWSFMTPSVAQTLTPDDVPTLKTLVLGGEAVTMEHVERWTTTSSPSPSLINGYGPAEATICAVGPIVKDQWQPGAIGQAVGGVGWVTMPSDPSRLVAIGAIGELLLEGPFLAQGYLNQPELTAASFIDPPTWRLALPLPLGAGMQARLYRTGDLVQYLGDGSIRYIGRRDTQVKIRGQRVDLAEIEARVRHAMGGGGPDKVVAEAIQNASSALLAVFVLHPTVPGTRSLLVQLDADSRQIISRVHTYLQTVLPAYMVPSVFIPISYIPTTVTGKLDRRALRDQVLSLSPEELQQYRIVRRRPAASSPAVRLTEDERRLRKIWAEVLGVPSEAIAASDSFLFHGGDSVTAMRMLALARREQFSFTVADVLSDVPLDHLARQRCLPCLPLRPRVKQSTTRQATYMQSFFMQRYPWTHWRFRIRGHLDVPRLRKACTQLISAHSILRTRFEASESPGTRPVQIVLPHLETPLYTISTDQDLESYTKALCQAEQDIEVLGANAPTRLTLVSNAPRTAHVLMVRLSHAQYDGICVPRLFADLQASYNGEAPIVATDFERYLDDRSRYDHLDQRTNQFWREYLAGSSPPCALLPAQHLQPSRSPSVVSAARNIAYTALPSGTTLAMVIKASACLALARRTHQRDILVGQIVSGRSVALPDIDRIVGPCVNCIPFRARIDPNATVHEYLGQIQQQHNSSIAHEGPELSTITKQAPPHLRTAGGAAAPEELEFGFILQHQNIDMDLSLDLAGAQYVSFASSGSLRPGSEVWICSTPRSGAVEIEVIGSSAVLSADGARTLVEDIAEMTRSLLDSTESQTRLAGLVGIH